MRTTTVGARALEWFARDLLEGHGLEHGHAELVARSLLWAELRGVASHGVARLPTYVRWLGSGEMNTAAQLSTRRRAPALALLDADRAPGAVALDEAMRVAASMAGECGTGTVFVRNTTHTGALGACTSRLAQQGFAAVAMAASGPNMIYHGAAAPGVSTAPLSIAVPRPGDPLVFDMASGATALGRILQARRDGSALPENVAADGEGRPTRDAQRAVAPLPLGGPKGSGLALMSELLCSAFTGAAILAPALADRDAPQPHRQNALVLAIDVKRLLGAAESAIAVEALADAIHSLPAAHGAEVLLPGERGSRERNRREREGIPLSDGVAAELEALAASLEITCPWSAS
jgi:LDH2 family malate/lactate/ureidoglycolate dehydrogenase